MSTPDQPTTPPLTRRQLRELRTGATPVITPDMANATDTGATDTGVATPGHADAPAPTAPLPHPAEPVAVPVAPAPDASVDLGTAPLTRRQARQQERIRTASVPVITPDFAAAHAQSTAAPLPSFAPVPAAEPTLAAASDARAAGAVAEPVESAEATVAATQYWRWGVASDDADAASAAGEQVAEVVAAPSAEPIAMEPVETVPAPDPEKSDLDVFESEGGHVAAETGDRPVLNPAFGAGLLSGAQPMPAPSSFDQLLERDTATTGSVASPSTLIVSQGTSEVPLTAPVAATGEVLVTGTFELPEGLGSTGHVPGTTDGKEIDAVLVDGELPAHSSPTPIAASAAVSTVKTNDDLIRPPAPEKGNRLMLTLAITAGVLALALVGVLIMAFVTGVFS